MRLLLAMLACWLLALLPVDLDLDLDMVAAVDEAPSDDVTPTDTHTDGATVLRLETSILDCYRSLHTASMSRDEMVTPLGLTTDEPRPTSIAEA